ncbi:hypothetical protein RIF29_39495 [Crotalaria pallida]|uniref:Uncharacterized protein n=1 Tax=Crotalaria pallida TaxID=3830 RepID=A0AAN9E1W6_CROPI
MNLLLKIAYKHLLKLCRANNSLLDYLVGIDINNEAAASMASYLGCRLGYLSIPIGINHIRDAHWNGLINMLLKAKLSAWKGRCLSFGRVELSRRIWFVRLFWFIFVLLLQSAPKDVDEISNAELGRDVDKLRTL